MSILLVRGPSSRKARGVDCVGTNTAGCWLLHPRKQERARARRQLARSRRSNMKLSLVASTCLKTTMCVVKLLCVSSDSPSWDT